MKNKLLGIGMMSIGAALILSGIYLSIWVLLVGGLVDIINQIKSNGPVDAFTIACGVVKLIFFEAPLFISWLGAMAFGFGIYKLTD